MWLAAASLGAEQVLPLDGDWQFCLDRQQGGLRDHWEAPELNRSGWRLVTVPHTWQVEPGNEDYAGAAWYARRIAPEPAWQNRSILIEFDAVNRDAVVWVNGARVGEHSGSGYTPFSIEPGGAWDCRRTNEIVVRVDNQPSTNALPYLNSFDWPRDGGIIRGARVRALPPSWIQSMRVTPALSADRTRAAIAAELELRLKLRAQTPARVEVVIYAPGGVEVVRATAALPEGAAGPFTARVTGTIERPQLWHFDQPWLYRAVGRLIRDNEVMHERVERFGIRTLKVEPGRFVLNGEPMRLMGVEWMPGSDPRRGLAESPDAMRAILTDLKRLNCVLTRFHWQQDDAVFEFCDREGLLVQEEIPAWGTHPLESAALASVQQAQLRETILPHFNHPSIFAWGLCNEIRGLSAEGRVFLERGRDIARAHDPQRLLTYASNTLHYKPERDAAGLLDFIEWNEYFGSWYRGGAVELEQALAQISSAWPDKGIVISEYGLCECAENHPRGDARRIAMLESHTEVLRRSRAVAGAIVFDYNDYRTHLGDRGDGAFRQRVHGVVDLFGQRKPSWEALRRAASPVRELEITTAPEAGRVSTAIVRLVTRSLTNDLPAYTLRRYTLVWSAWGSDGLPLAAGSRDLPDLAPGVEHREALNWSGNAARVRAEVLRPTGYPVVDADWAAAAEVR